MAPEMSVTESEDIKKLVIKERNLSMFWHLIDIVQQHYIKLNQGENITILNKWI